ncbi:hypothetical protein [Thermodesulfovibrio sp.]|jgi:hypothetical protein|uniref:hypothetical protein n=1 Tax=Thermodesulfovibrio TaxID=28261 RepID=UPI00263A1FE6|nr:hypothetical protein [Thermodesulfovibrio sp.]
MKVYDLLAKVDSTVTENGEKAKWAKIGVLLEKEKGFSIKLDCIPISSSWDGWLTVKERKEKEQTEEPF